MRTDKAVERLIQRARSGDAAAFENLARRFHPVLFRWALTWTGDPNDADDVAQEALVKMHRHLAAYDGRSAFSTWLYQVTRNAATDLHRSKSRERRIADAMKLEREPSVPPNQDALESTDSVELVRTFLENLSPRQREVFDLCDLQGYAPSEVARMLELEPATVRVHLLRARSTIRTQILRHHPEAVEDHGC